MALDGLLQKMSFGEIFQTVSMCKQSGVLTLTDEHGVGRLVFSEGLLFQASLDRTGRLGESLVKRGVITTEELENALEIQRNSRGENLPLGAILEKNGIVSKEILQTELKRHLIDVVRTLLGWETGSFHFEFGTRIKKEALLDEGLSLPSLLIEATRPSDLWRLELQTDLSASHDHRDEWTRFTSMLLELLQPISANETALLVLRYASELFNRSVIFLIKKKELVGMGQSGLQFRDEEADARVKNIRIPLSDSSLFLEVIGRMESYKGVLEQQNWHQYFIDQIGGDWPSELFLVPISDGKDFFALVYGDNVPNQSPLPDTRGLEAFVKIVGVAQAKAALERKLVEQKSSRKGNIFLSKGVVDG